MKNKALLFVLLLASVVFFSACSLKNNETKEAQEINNNLVGTVETSSSEQLTVKSAVLNDKYFETTKIPEEGLREGGIYRNYEYKFEFEYPKEVILTDKDLNTDELPVLKVAILKDYDLRTKEAEDISYNETIDRENEKLTETYGKNNFMPTMGRGGELVNINNNTFYIIKHAGEGFFGVGRYAYIQIGGDVLLLEYSAGNKYFEKVATEHNKGTSWSYDSERELLNNEVDDILQSFKFISN